MFGFKILYSQQKYNFISKKHLYLKEKVMITLRGMAEESYINVFNYQCLTLLLYRYKYVDSYFPPNSLSLFFTFPFLYGKQIRRQPGPFTQMQICFLTKRKIENWPIYGQAYISVV